MITRKTQGDFVKLLSDSFAFDVSDSDLLLRAVLKKGHVVFLHSTTTKSSIMETAKKILSITSQDPACNKHLSGLRSSVIRLMKRVKVFQKSLTRSWKLMVEFLNEEFLLPTPSISALKAQSHQNVPSSDPVATTSSLFLHPAVLPSKKLKTDCSKCESRRKKIWKLMTQKNKLKSDIKFMKKKCLLNHHLHQSLKRKCKIEENLRKKRRILKRECSLRDAKICRLEEENSRLKAQQELKNLRRSNKKLNENHKKYKLHHDDKLKKSRKAKSELTKRVLELESITEELHAQVEYKAEEMELPKLVSTKINKKTYSASFRKAAYHCLNNQVPVETISCVISNIVSELSDVTLDFLPDKKTISQCAYELGVISDIQVGEVLVNNENLTLAWDATSLDAQHVNEVHIHTSPSLSSGYVLQVSNLPGGTTEDYTEHIKNCISDVVQTYALFNGEDELVTKGKVISHLKNTLSDRVAVNHCVVQKIQDDFHIELLELKCNVHPLDGIAHKCRSNLKKYDTEHNIKGDIFGSDCCAANLIYCMAFQR